MPRHDSGDVLAEFLAGIGAAWYAIALQDIVGWATAIGGFLPGSADGEGYLVRGEELGPEFGDWIRRCVACPDTRDTLTIIVSDVSPHVVARIQILGARAITKASPQQGRVVVAYDEVIVETA
ncbi:hypothetical protein FEK33_13175 [Nocardia asteroides NBRC 15531]|uniref:Uncharacterized protein n=1 Tax=Nocardia asteroides NBRC 15531 TaxID=1110697 RepID=U5EJF6_NOCAS|nr:hypothetical protein [Nocardia asteroides]TLF66966.1 hypothetical protein FEK33_13175 [Nocardia asteroides NBRC 15531]UGT51779.1 hypothetical protein LT345_15015 [Nocardia asteroides]SFM17113.1 hypothetical protein SAMN05444423_10292 [Nocardia asteroides]VEG35311.1 Uncharacterised protein [Nocardia asteroides]GAD86531.1 hypothetical protein NCAST_32_10180 [Nocardia asteroides NBRC 15531]